MTLSDAVAILDHGKIVQEGRPEAIYERPRTRFAASFLGDANFFSGRVTDGGVEIAGGVVRTNDRLPAIGASATVAVRPEKMKICGTQTAATGNSDENRLLAVVREIIYAGAVSTIPAGERRRFADQDSNAKSRNEPRLSGRQRRACVVAGA